MNTQSNEWNKITLLILRLINTPFWGAVLSTISNMAKVKSYSTLLTV